jgi:hypothetical protein
MKIALIGPGIMAIPPPGWGAVEILIWDYYKELMNQGHSVDIINKIRSNDFEQRDPESQYCRDLISIINSKDYDFVHLHYDVLYHILSSLKCHRVAITSHYPNLGLFHKHKEDQYTEIFEGICNNTNHYIFAPSKKDLLIFESKCKDPSKLFLVVNSSDHREITPNFNGKFTDRSIYLGRIEERKQQHKYYSIPGIDFYGRCIYPQFSQLSCYKGEPSRAELVDLLSNYGNLVHLSACENATPLVIKEALLAGLPVVTNKWSMDDLDPDLPFIDVVPDDKLDDLGYIYSVICQNRSKQHLKSVIRDYAYQKFSTEVLVKAYIDKIKTVL